MAAAALRAHPRPRHDSLPLPRERSSQPFSIQEFSDLVSTAFNLCPPDIALCPASPAPSRPRSRYARTIGPNDTLGRTPISSYFETDTADEHAAYVARCNTDARSATVASRPAKRLPRALDMLKSVRTRASALVLRQSDTKSTADPTLCNSLYSNSSQRPAPRSRPSLSLLSRPETPSATASIRTRPSTPFRWAGRQTEKHPPLNRTKTNPISFLNFSPSKRDTISTIASAASQATCTTSSTSYKTPADQNISADSDADVASLARLPSFFEDTGYAERRPRAPSYTRPATPSPSLFAFYANAPEPAAQQPAKIHTRLPPLRKAKSASTSLFRVGLGRRERKVSCAAALMVEKNPSKVAMDWSEGDAFMCPRDAPPVPPSPTSQKMPQWALSDEDEPLEVPAYVFERRGSEASTSTNSTLASIKSGSSLTERLAAMLPLSLPAKSKRARSKLSLAMTTDSSPESSTGAWSPVTPPGFAFGFPGQVKGECGYGYEEEDAMRVGRVLTPEEDPFAKADIAIEGRNEDSREGMTPTPTPMMRRDNERQYKIVPKKMPALDGGTAAKAYEMMAEDGPDEVSVAWTFPSSCDIVPARTVAANEEVDEEEDRRQAPTPTLMSMMAERDRRLVSRFSTPSSSAEDGEEAGEIEVEAVVEDTVVVEASAPSQTRLPNPARKSLPSPSPFCYEGKRKASVRTVASEPARVQRPGSPFPLMRDLSDGSCRSMRKATGKVFGLADDSGVDLGMSISVNMEREAREQEKGLNDSFVLPVVQAVPMTRRERVKNGDISVREKVSPDAAEDRLTPRPPSASSCIHLCVPIPTHPRTPRPSMDSNTTVTPSRLRGSICSSADPHPRPQSASIFPPKTEPAHADAEWDRRTVASSATGRSRSSTFYSARSSVGSVREVPLKDNA